MFIKRLSNCHFYKLILFFIGTPREVGITNIMNNISLTWLILTIHATTETKIVKVIMKRSKLERQLIGNHVLHDHTTSDFLWLLQIKSKIMSLSRIAISLMEKPISISIMQGYKQGRKALLKQLKMIMKQNYKTYYLKLHIQRLLSNTRLTEEK